MKSITEILGGSQILLNISYELQDVFEEYLTEHHKLFLSTLSLAEEYLPAIEIPEARTGRKPYKVVPFVRAFLAKSFFKLESNKDLRIRLKSDSSLRKICGFSKVPSEATFSRRFEYLSHLNVMEQVFNQLTTKHHQNHIIGHISRDSSAIAAREKPVNTKKEVKPEKQAKRKRGRPKKGEIIPPKEEKRLSRQIRQKPQKSIKELNSHCAWGCKKNSQGNTQYWKGYKLHLDVTELGIPISAVVTGANVHDSQVAIPLEKMTEKKITHLYSLMDAAYDAPQIRDYIKQKGRIDLIDYNKRRKTQVKKMDPAEKRRFKIRSSVERSFSHLKDLFIPSKIYLKGDKKIKTILMTAVLCLTAVKILQFEYENRIENAA